MAAVFIPKGFHSHRSSFPKESPVLKTTWPPES